MEIEILAWWIIGLVVLAIVVTGFFIIKNKDVGAIEYIKNLLRFRR